MCVGGGRSFAGDSKGSHGCASTWSKGDQQGAKPQVEGKEDTMGWIQGTDTRTGGERDMMGGQEGVRSQNLVSELNALGKRKSAGVLCRGVARVDSSGIGRGRCAGQESSLWRESWASEPGLGETLNSPISV